MLVGLAHKVGTPPTRSHARTWSSLPQSTGLNRAREARTQDWGLKIQLSPFPCKLVAAAQGAPVALRHIKLSHAHPRWETPPAHPACQGWGLLQGIPQPPGLSLTWGCPSRGQAAARSVLARGRSALPGAEVPRESPWGSWERGGDSRGKGQASRQLPACPVRPSTAPLRGTQSCTTTGKGRGSGPPVPGCPGDTRVPQPGGSLGVTSPSPSSLAWTPRG